jgi:hypothetical protein
MCSVVSTVLGPLALLVLDGMFRICIARYGDHQRAMAFSLWPVERNWT